MSAWFKHSAAMPHHCQHRKYRIVDGFNFIQKKTQKNTTGQPVLARKHYHGTMQFYVGLSSPTSVIPGGGEGLQLCFRILTAVHPTPGIRNLKLDCSWAHLQIVDCSLTPPLESEIWSWNSVELTFRFWTAVWPPSRPYPTHPQTLQF